MTQAEEVRRCRACGQAAATLDVAWSHSLNGMATQHTTREFRCQACGAEFTLRHWTRLVGMAIAGLIFVPTCIGFPILGLAFWRWKQDDWNPVVPGATPPPRRFRSGPPARVCSACGGQAVARRITAHVHNGMPTGTDYDYVCSKCNAEFTIESPWGQVFSTLSGTTILGVAVACLVLGTTWAWRLGGGACSGVLAVFLLSQVAWRLLNRIRNPALPGS